MTQRATTSCTGLSASTRAVTKQIYAHYTCATDTQQIKCSFLLLFLCHSLWRRLSVWSRLPIKTPTRRLSSYLGQRSVSEFRFPCNFTHCHCNNNIYSLISFGPNLVEIFEVAERWVVVNVWVGVVYEKEIQVNAAESMWRTLQVWWSCLGSWTLRSNREFHFSVIFGVFHDITKKKGNTLSKIYVEIKRRINKLRRILHCWTHGLVLTTAFAPLGL